MERTAAGKFDDLKAAVKRLDEVYDRMQALILRRTESLSPTHLSEESKSGEELERKVQRFSEDLISFLKQTKRTKEAFAALKKNLKGLQGATDVGEISTLMGLTASSDREEYNRAATGLVKCYETKLRPAMPEIVKIVDYAGEITDFTKWFDSFINRDLATGKDDLTEMIRAIRDRDPSRFNEIYKGLIRRIEAEERRHTKESQKSARTS